MNPNDKNTDNELKALISLLDEEDELILRQVENKILSYGTKALPELEKAWENTLDNYLQNRIENISHKINFLNVYHELSYWNSFDNQNLLQAFITVAKFQFPNLKEETVIQQFEDIYKDIWLELNDNLTALEKVKVINHVLFEIYGFTSNKANYYAPQNSYVNQVLESRKGNPLSLGIIYLIIAQKLNIPISGVNLPEHFILAYTNKKNDNYLSFLDENYVLFYINPFSKGIVFTKKEIDVFLKNLKIQSLPDYYLPCQNSQIIKRLLNNLIVAYQKIENTTKVAELKKLLKIFD